MGQQKDTEFWFLHRFPPNHGDIPLLSLGVMPEPRADVFGESLDEEVGTGDEDLGLLAAWI